MKAFDLLAFWSLNIVIVVHSASKALFCTVCSSDHPTFGRKSLNWKGSKKKREKKGMLPGPEGLNYKERLNMIRLILRQGIGG